ncbi:hypothetical protein Btru_025627 [Bulinus truncatus]|nr:hypothetical protein Btru_025627 [Bulinus truncatus]
MRYRMVLKFDRLTDEWCVGELKFIEVTNGDEQSANRIKHLTGRTFSNLNPKNTNEVSSNSPELISNYMLLTLELFMTTPIHAGASSIGVVTNLLIMMVQARLGLSSSIGVGVFALSLTDFFVTFIDLAVIGCNLLTQVTTVDTPVDIYGLGQIILAWFRYPGFFISSWIMTVMSMEKCLAVACPLRVKQIFTRNRTIAVLVVIYMTFISVVFTIYGSIYMDWKVVDRSEANGSMAEKKIYTVIYTENAGNLERAIDIMCAFVLSVMSHVILIACTAVMVYCLKISSRIRRRESGSEKVSMTVAHRRLVVMATTCLASQQSFLTQKEKRMVKVVLCLAAVLIACNVPRYANIVLYCAFPEFVSGATRNLSWLLWGLNDFCITVNCSSNFIVYWTLNSKFRRACRQMFTFKTP